MQLTDEERAVLAHMVIDPDAWITHALATVGEAAVRAKIANRRPEYLAARVALGAAYKTRAERDAEAAA